VAGIIPYVNDFIKNRLRTAKLMEAPMDNYDSEKKMPFFIKIMPTVSNLSFLAGAVGFFWLLFTGGWRLSVLGCIVMIIAMKVLSFVIFIVQMFFVSILGMPKEDTSGGAAIILSNLVTWIVMTVWCLAVTWYVFGAASRRLNLIPVVLWAYTLATGPIGALAFEDMKKGNIFSMIMTLCLQLAFISTVILTASQLLNPFYGFITSYIVFFVIYSITVIKLLRLDALRE
jgi:hypothetical protein